MNRLTHIDCDGWYIEDQSIPYDGRRRGEEINRLAAYEDTGLTPEEVKLMKGSWRAVCTELGLNGFTMKEDHDGQTDN